MNPFVKHFPHSAILVATLATSGLANAGGSPEDINGSSASTDVKPRLAAATDGSASTAKESSAPTDPSTIQFYASDKALEVQYQKPGELFNLGNSSSSVGFLLNEERDNAFIGTIMFEAEPALLRAINFEFGVRSIIGFIANENNDIFGIGLNLAASYDLPVEQFPIHLSAEVGYAPDILSFGQADRIIDWNVRVGTDITKKLHAFVGFRFLQFDTRPGDDELDDRVHIGVSWNPG